MAADSEPYCWALEFARTEQPDDPFAFRFAEQTYLIRGEGGSFRSIRLPWDPALLADLQALLHPNCGVLVLQRFGALLRKFLSAAEWAAQEAAIVSALAAGRPVLLAIRSSAAELYALPWELLTLQASGQHLGEIANLLVRYEWPATATCADQPSPRKEDGRILLAWSAAGGAVPAAQHLAAIQVAARAGCVAFDETRDVLPHVSPGRLRAALLAAQQTGPPVAVLHLLCHGSAADGIVGLALDGETAGEQAPVTDAGLLRQLLAPFSGMVRLVVLSACESSNPGPLGNQLGSLAQTLHRAGLPAVIASRFPLSTAGSVKLTAELYHELLVPPRSLESALCRARAALAADTMQKDWAGLQLYARAADGHDSRPIIFRPYRGLLAFQPEHHRFFFGREREIAEILTDLQALEAAGRPRFLVVTGASGTGKSSLVLGGAVPRILANKNRRLARMRPGNAPDFALQEALGQHRDADAEILLVVDQLEEIFTQVEEAQQRQSFLQRVWALARDPKSRISVLCTLRVDFLGRCGELVLDEQRLHLDRVVYDEAHQVFIAKLDRAALQAAIEGPAHAVGLMLEDGLVARMLEDVGDEPGALPLLQDSLDLLWQRRQGRLLTQSAYETLGGVSGALHRRADALIDSLSGPQQVRARRLLVRLVCIGDNLTLGTRRRLLLDKLRPGNEDSAGAAEFDAVLAALVEARLVVCDGDGKAQTVELAHETLIRTWQRLSGWIKVDCDMLTEVGKLEAWIDQAANDNEPLFGKRLRRAQAIAEKYSEEVSPRLKRALAASHQAESRRQQKRRALWAVEGVLILCAVVLVAWALVKHTSRRDNARPSQEAQSAAAAASSQAPPSRDRDGTLHTHRVRLSTDTIPQGAQVIRQQDGRLLGVTPLLLAEEPAGNPLPVRLRLSGYKEKVIILDLSHDAARQEILIPESEVPIL